MGSHMGVVNLKDYSCVILVMGMAAFHSFLGEGKKKRAMCMREHILEHALPLVQLSHLSE